MSYAAYYNMSCYEFDPAQLRQRSAKTTNKDRILADLLDDVIQGYRTVWEANAAYGTKPPRSRGQPRRFATFADYLMSRIRYAEDTEVEQHLRNLLSRAAHRQEGWDDRTWTRCGAETNRINHLLKVTGKAYADQLRELLADLDYRPNT
jgi:hypothetical protein